MIIHDQNQGRRRRNFEADLTRYPIRGSSLSYLSNGVRTMLVRLIKFKFAMQVIAVQLQWNKHLSWH